jgi:uncharacterized protein YndB with AHSA1/START domain
MATRSISVAQEINAPIEKVFDALITPSDICAWWGAATAIVLAEPGGTWAGARGEIDHPDDLPAATLIEFSRPQRLVPGDYRYRARTGPLPFKADFKTSFDLRSAGIGTLVSVEQTGFPSIPEADDFYQGCLTGLASTRQNCCDHLAGRSVSN